MSLELAFIFNVSQFILVENMDLYFWRKASIFRIRNLRNNLIKWFAQIFIYSYFIADSFLGFRPEGSEHEKGDVGCLLYTSVLSLF